MQPIYKQLKVCGNRGSYSASLILGSAAAVSVKQRGTDAAAGIQPHTSSGGNSRAVPAFPEVFMGKGINQANSTTSLSTEGGRND